MNVFASAAAQPEVVVRGLGKTFVPRGRRAPVVALENVDITVPTGEICSLLGPSGCGKSTILSILAGFETATLGEVLVGGKPITGPDPSRAFVFQQPQLFPWLDVWGNLLFGPRVQGRAGNDARERATFLLEATGLTEFRHHRVYELSGGMKQRVAIARALINRPEVLLMDEPFGALDAQTRLIMQQLLMRIWEELRPTILFVTHDVDEALFLGSTVYVMKARPGRIKCELSVDLERPRTIDSTTSDRFIALKKTILGALHDEVLAASI